MKTQGKMTGLLIAAVLALSTSGVYADSGNGGNFGGSGWGHHGHSGRGGFFHNLTDDQKKQMKAIWEKQKEAKKAAFEQIKADKEALTAEPGFWNDGERAGRREGARVVDGVPLVAGDQDGAAVVPAPVVPEHVVVALGEPRRESRRAKSHVFSHRLPDAVPDVHRDVLDR